MRIKTFPKYTKIDVVRTCSKCQIEQPICNFNKHTQNPTGISYWCKSCCSEAKKKYYKRHSFAIKEKQRLYVKEHAEERNTYSKTYYQKNKVKRKRYNLSKLYNMSEYEYYRMIEIQDNKCAICGTEELVKDLAVDHNHITGHVRGLLCHKCNKAIGLLNADEGVELLKKAISYLEVDQRANKNMA